MKTFLFTFGAFVSLAPSAFAGIHNYRAPQVSPTEQGCLANETLVAERFAQLTESKILSHGCEQNPGKTFDIVIEYARPTAPILVTTYGEFDRVHGLYDSGEECAANRDSQIQTFRNATGLEPLVAYCFYDYLNEFGDTSWTLRIDAFGKAKLHPYNHVRTLFSSALANSKDLENGITAALAVHGAVGAQAKIDISRDYTSIHAAYYAEKELALVEYDTSFFGNLAHCEYYRNVFETIYTRAGGHSAAYFCAKSTLYETIRSYGLGVVTEPLASKVTAVKYPNFQACEAKRTETEEAWRVGLERNVVGSVCAVEDTIVGHTVEMRMFWIE